MYLPSNVAAIANDVNHDLDLHFRWIPRKRWELQKNSKFWLFRGRCLPSKGTIANVVHRDLDLNFQGQVIQWLFWQGLEKRSITIAIRWEVRYLPSNGATASVVHHDLDLHFQGYEFWSMTISKTVRVRENAEVWLLWRLIFAIKWDHCQCWH